MCGRYSLTTDEKQLQTRFVARTMPHAQTARYNIAPTQPVWALVHAQAPQIVALRWGLIPSWAEDKAIGNRMINARAEGIAQKPSFRRAIRKRRFMGTLAWAPRRSYPFVHYYHHHTERPHGRHPSPHAGYCSS